MNSTNEKNDPIGIFDSGIGGVTVLTEILKLLPNEKYLFYSDSKNNPYGSKTQKKIIEMSDYIVDKFVKRNAKAVVIACNTASANASGFLRRKYNIPIIAIEPAYKMVNDFARDNVTLVMATKGTIESEKFEMLYKKYDNKKTYLLECEGLANAIERNNDKDIEKILEKELAPYVGKARNVVLGCTHYPLAQKKIEKILCNNGVDHVEFFNGAEGVARNLKKILEERDLVSNNTDRKIDNIEFYDSSNSEEKARRFYEIIRASINKKLRKE